MALMAFSSDRGDKKRGLKPPLSAGDLIGQISKYSSLFAK
jgi:hypothetical protein